MNIAIILAAGQGLRLKLGYNKILAKLEKPILCHTLDCFESHENIEQMIVVANKDEVEIISRLIKQGGFKKVKQIVVGGSTRQESSWQGVDALPKEASIVVVHDGARPFVFKEVITSAINEAKRHGASVVCLPAVNTIKVGLEGLVKNTLSRDNLYITQTPQVFKVDLLKQAHQQALKDNFVGSDDSVLVERFGVKVKLVKGNEENFKITSPHDLILAKKIMNDHKNQRSFRVGLGEDSHAFLPHGGKLILGGVEVTETLGLDAESDGDVVLHSLCNALSSAVGKGSLGTYASQMCRDGIMDSKDFLQVALGYVKETGYKTGNVSISIEAKTPKLEKYIPKMKETIAGLCSIDSNCVGITATSGDGLTSFGQGKGIKAVTIVSLKLC